MTVSEKEKERLNQSALRVGGIFAGLGACLMFSGNFVGGNVAITLLIVGIGFVGMGCVFIVKGGEFGAAYVAKNKRDLVNGKEGIVWVWIVALLTWAIMAVAYFALSIVVYMVLDNVQAMAVLPPEYLANITLTRNVTQWFLIIMTIGIIGWALINSVRRVDDTSVAY